MPGLRVYTGPLKGYYFFSSDILESIQKDRHDYLAILPVNRAVRIFKRMMIDFSDKKVLNNAPVFTFNALLLKLYQSMPGAKRVISPEMFSLIIEEILENRLDDLQYFSSGGSAAGSLIKKTTEMITELRRFGYNSDEFENLQVREKRDFPIKYDNFRTLLSALDIYLKDELIDEPFALHTAAGLITKDQFRIHFPNVTKIYISGYGLFTPAMYTLIEKLGAWYDVHLKLEYQAENLDLFAHTSAAYERFFKMGAEIIKIDSENNLSISLFNRQTVMPEKLDQINRIETTALKHREEEIEFMAWRIRRLNLDLHIPLHKIAVTFSNMERYVPLIRQKFNDYGIPFNLSTGFALNQSPLIRAFMNCISLIESGIEYNDVINFFTSAFLDTPEDLNAQLLKKIFTEKRIRYLTEKQLSRLSGVLEKMNRSNGDTYFDKRYQIDLIASLLQPFFDFPKQANTGTLRSAYITLLKRLNLLTWYKNENSRLDEREKENEFRAFNRFMKLLDKLVWTLNYLHGSKEISLSYFFRSLQNAVNQAVYNLTELPDYGVQIMPRLEILAVDFDVLFVGGLVDGDFPRASTRDVFFNDTVREEMHLLASEELLDQDRFIFYSLLDAAADKIILTHPKYQDDRALTPSTFLADLDDAVIISAISETDDENFINLKKQELDFGLQIQKQAISEARDNARELFVQMPVEDALWLLNKIGNARQRIIPGRFTEIEGNISYVAQIREMLARQYGYRTWSVTQLEAYAYCPMQFFLDRVLRVEDEPEFEENLNNMERGNLIHEILFRFFSELKKSGKTRRPADSGDLLFEVAEVVFNEMPFSGFFWDLERAVYFGTENSPGLLHTFLNYDQEQIIQTGFTPDLFEFAFGYTFGSVRDQSSSTRTVVLKSSKGQIKINGKIDRIDKDQSGNALIFDYKTGVQASSVQAGEILEGLRFQLPLYMLAYNELENDSKAVYAGYYLVKDADNCKRKDVLADKSGADFLGNNARAALPNKNIVDNEGAMLTLQELLNYSLDAAIQKTEELKQGIFRHTRYPDDIVCQQYCAFRRMCQKNVGKLRKNHAATD
jgi:ATP-dependent helicase/nuclease subunit B